MPTTPVAPPPEGKTCSKCGEHYADVEASFYRRSGGRYWASHCRGCNRAAKKRADAGDPEKHRAQKRAEYAADPEKHRQRQRDLRSSPEGREAKARYNRRYRQKNRERLREKDRQYSRDNREKRAAANRRYREENAEALREYEAKRSKTPKRRALSRRVNREWHANNPAKAKAKKARRRAAEATADGTITAADIRAQKKRQRGRCYWCSEKVGRDFHVDHFVPLSKGGSNGPENVVIACPPCNLRKNNLLPSEFAGVLDL